MENAPVRLGVNTGFVATGGFAGAVAGAGGEFEEEYLAPDASETFWRIPSGVRSRSERAVIWT